jgi:hypothetical protein
MDYKKFFGDPDSEIWPNLGAAKFDRNNDGQRIGFEPRTDRLTDDALSGRSGQSEEPSCRVLSSCGTCTNYAHGRTPLEPQESRCWAN